MLRNAPLYGEARGRLGIVSIFDIRGCRLGRRITQPVLR
jgi:hypothetical protein